MEELTSLLNNWGIHSEENVILFFEDTSPCHQVKRMILPLVLFLISDYLALFQVVCRLVTQHNGASRDLTKRSEVCVPSEWTESMVN